MKKLKRLTAILLALITALACYTVFPGTLHTKAAGNDDKRAVWISYIDIEHYLKDRTKQEFSKNFKNMCKTAKSHGLNTVIVQVRPMGDAIYPSSYYPWSYFISSSLSNPGYDPLAFMVEIAHAQGMKIEAWFNPYRLSRDEKTTERYKNSIFYERYKNDILEFAGGNGQTWMSFDPASQNARNVITDGICEVVKTYKVDGVHLDDYFYVTGMPLADNPAARRNNVNALIKQIYSSVKSIRKDCEFGISPAGNYENCLNMGADVDTWLSVRGYVDYLMPQIYWTDNWNGQNLFKIRSELFYNKNKIGIPMYVGLALYRVGEESSVDRSWSTKDTNLMEQYKLAHEMGYDGFALFRYQWLDKYEQGHDGINAVAATELENLQAYLDTLSGAVSEGCVVYYTHVQGIGWEAAARKDGATSGTVGKSKRLESIVIQKGHALDGIGGNILYRVHCQTYGWMDWVGSGVPAGTTGQGKRLEAIEIKLTGELAKKYDIYYRVHAQNFGWMNWAKNGETSGTAGYSYRLEAIQIMMVEKGGEAPNSSSSESKTFRSPKISYCTHVQSLGWISNSFDGGVNGTTGSGLRMESIIIRNQTGIPGNIRYRVHCQTYGWMGWVKDGTAAGTQGQSKRLEAIRIELTGELAKQYDIFYRVHVQHFGWLDWAKNGEAAGSSGFSYRLEAVQIVLMKKGHAAPGADARPYVKR